MSEEAQAADAAGRIVEIVADALEREPSTRAAFLDAACGTDVALRARAEALLRFEEPARAFIEAPAIAGRVEAFLAADAAVTGGTLPPDQTLGDCRILSLLGEGGMGEVYLAEDTGLGRKVAVKLIKRGMATETLRRHFGQEKRILAGLNDPHIARLYGGAVAPDGRPYLVMEYVEGERLDDYCDKRRLPLAARLALFRKVCSAVAYAHQHLVIHRDLKPANIRVTPEGEPKLLDFGIAKLLDPQATDGGAEQTVTVLGAMTPGYASPEQLRGEAVTTATDIYSLGVVFYELISGRRPFAASDRRSGETARTVGEQIATRPSAAAGTTDAAAARGTTSSRLPRQLVGDLDNIALMALRHEPARRYASVSQFSEDIRRHLDGQPVAARKDTLRYVGAKFIARNKAAAVAAALVLLTLFGGIAATAWQARRADGQRLRAERRFEDVRRLADALMFEIHDSVQGLPGSTPTRKLIVSRALEYLDILSQEADNPALRRDLATAYEKIGDIQGNPYSPNLGDTDGALASYRKAEDLRETFSKDGPPPTVEDRLALGRAYRAVGDILEVKGNLAEMTRHYRQSLDVFARLDRDHPSHLTVRDELCRAYEVLGDGLERTEDGHAERLRSYEQCLASRQSLLAQAPDDVKFRRSLGVILGKLGWTSLPDKIRAVDYANRAVTILKALARENPESVRARNDYAYSLFKLGNVLADTGDYAAALPVRRETLPIRQEAAAADPQDKRAQFDLAAAETDLSDALTGAGQPEEALGHARAAVAGLEAITAADPTNTVYLRNTGLCYEKTGDVYSALATRGTLDASTRRAHWTEAQNAYEKARKVFTGLRAGGTARSTDAGKPEALTAKIVRCQEDAARLEK